MASELDPQGAEPQALLDAADFNNARVLEVGSGDGRLAFRYAEACPFVAGIEPKVEEVASAVDACPSHLRRRLKFMRASAVALPFRDETFDIALLAWSL